MISGNDRPATLAGLPAALDEVARELLAQPFLPISHPGRLAQLEELCEIIGQMRREDRRRQWIDRLAGKLCADAPPCSHLQATVRAELVHRVTLAQLRYHTWREAHAPVAERRPS